MDSPRAAANPSGVQATGFEFRSRATGRNHLNVLPDSLLELLLSRVSARTGGYSHALVCRRWAALASSAQALVRLCPPWNPLEESQQWDECRGNLQPDRGTLAWPHLKLHVSTEELIRALQSLPQVTALYLPGISMYDVTREQFLRLLRACPRLRALRAPGLSLRPDPMDPREEWCYWKLLRRNNATLPSAVLWDCAPDLRLLDVRCCRLVMGLEEQAAAAVDLELLVPGAGDHGTWDHGTGEAFALQQLRVLKASVQLPDHAEPLRLRSMPLLKALSLKLLREEDAEEHATPLLISSPSLKELHLQLPARLMLHLGPLPALRALSLTLSSSSRLAIPGLSRLTALTSLSLSGGCVPATEAGGDALAWLRALTKLRSLTWVSWAVPLPVSALGLLTGLTRLEVSARSLERTEGLAGWQGLRSLHSFSISMEPWRCVPAQLIEGAAELRTLKDLTVCIDGDEDESVDLNAVSSLQMLTSVVAYGPGSASLPLKQFPDLRHLTIHRGASMLQVPKEVSSLHSDSWLQRLERLLMSSCGQGLSSLQPLSTLQALRELSVFDCQGLKGVHPSLGTLPQLQKLQLEDLNDVKRLPPSFFSPPNFPSLTRLRMRLPLTLWPPSLRELPHLRVLEVNLMCSGSRRKHKLKDLLLPPSLEVFQLNDCRLIVGGGGAGEDFPCPMPRLRRLLLSDILCFPRLPRNLGSLRSLGHLQLQNLLRVESLPGSLTELSQLQGLVVQGCPKLKRIPQGCETLPCFVDDSRLLSSFELCDPSTC